MVLRHIAERIEGGVFCNIHFLPVHRNGIKQIPLIRLITDNAVMMEFHAVILLDILLTLYRFIPVRVINTDPAARDLCLHCPVWGSRFYLVAFHCHAVKIHLAAIIKIVILRCAVHRCIDNKRICLPLISHRTGQIGRRKGICHLMAVFIIRNRPGIQLISRRILQPCGHIIDLCRKFVNKLQRRIFADCLHAQRMHFLADTVSDPLPFFCFFQKCHAVFCLIRVFRPGDCYGRGTRRNPVPRMGVAPKIKSIPRRIQRYGNTVFIKGGTAQIVRKVIVASPERRYAAHPCNGYIGCTCRISGGSAAQGRSIFAGVQAVEGHKRISVKAYGLLRIHIEIIHFDLRP